MCKKALIYCGGARADGRPPTGESSLGENPTGNLTAPPYIKFAKEHIAGVIFIGERDIFLFSHKINFLTNTLPANYYIYTGTPHRGWKTSSGESYYTQAKIDLDLPDLRSYDSFSSSSDPPESPARSDTLLGGSWPEGSRSSAQRPYYGEALPGVSRARSRRSPFGIGPDRPSSEYITPVIIAGSGSSHTRRNTSYTGPGNRFISGYDSGSREATSNYPDFDPSYDSYDFGRSSFSAIPPNHTRSSHYRPGPPPSSRSHSRSSSSPPRRSRSRARSGGPIQTEVVGSLISKRAVAKRGYNFEVDETNNSLLVNGILNSDQINDLIYLTQTLRARKASPTPEPQEGQSAPGNMGESRGGANHGRSSLSKDQTRTRTGHSGFGPSPEADRASYSAGDGAAPGPAPPPSPGNGTNLKASGETGEAEAPGRLHEGKPEPEQRFDSQDSTERQSSPKPEYPRNGKNPEPVDRPTVHRSQETIGPSARASSATSPGPYGKPPTPPAPEDRKAKDPQTGVQPDVQDSLQPTATNALVLFRQPSPPFAPRQSAAPAPSTDARTMGTGNDSAVQRVDDRNNPLAANDHQSPPGSSRQTFGPQHRQPGKAGVSEKTLFKASPPPPPPPPPLFGGSRAPSDSQRADPQGTLADTKNTVHTHEYHSHLHHPYASYHPPSLKSSGSWQQPSVADAEDHELRPRRGSSNRQLGANYSALSPRPSPSQSPHVSRGSTSISPRPMPERAHVVLPPHPIPLDSIASSAPPPSPPPLGSIAFLPAPPPPSPFGLNASPAPPPPPPHPYLARPLAGTTPRPGAYPRLRSYRSSSSTSSLESPSSRSPVMLIGSRNSQSISSSRERSVHWGPTKVVHHYSPPPSTAGSSSVGYSRSRRGYLRSEGGYSESCGSDEGYEGDMQLIVYQDHLPETEDALWHRYFERTAKLERAVRRRKWDPLHRAESAFLEKLWKDFLGVCDQYYILSVFAEAENPSSYYFTERPIGKHTALLNVSNEKFLALEKEQEDLVRYADRDEAGYIQLEEEICDIVNRARLRNLEPVPGVSPEGQRIGLTSGIWEGLQHIDVTIRRLLEKHFPIEKDLHAETFTVSHEWRLKRPSHKIKEEQSCLHRLGDEYLWSGPEGEQRQQTGYLWVHVPGNDRSWAEVRRISSLSSSISLIPFLFFWGGGGECFGTN